MSTAIVTGAGRGFGRAIATALAKAGFDVVGVSRTAEDLASLADELPGFVPVVADATDPDVAGELVSLHRPDVLVLNAGAVPSMAPVHEQTWQGFSRSWEVDTRHVFEWTGAALRQPLAPGSVVVAVSSGAALRGSPLSGGYAAANAGVRFISSYAAGESAALGLGLRFVTLFPQLTPLGGVGAAGAAAYAAREGRSVAAYIESMRPVLTPQLVGDAVVEAVAEGGPAHVELLVMATGVEQLR
jgi:NADP-dependent 3-hydroxy acid dehydrogenase YdfG